MASATIAAHTRRSGPSASFRTPSRYSVPISCMSGLCSVHPPSLGMGINLLYWLRRSKLGRLICRLYKAEGRGPSHVALLFAQHCRLKAGQRWRPTLSKSKWGSWAMERQHHLYPVQTRVRAALSPTLGHVTALSILATVSPTVSSINFE